MRALTDRELDAVCGGGFSFSLTQSIYNRQSNYSSVGQSASAGWWSSASNSATVTQGNSANNQNIFQNVSF
jgi:hypothetical protein